MLRILTKPSFLTLTCPDHSLHSTLGLHRRYLSIKLRIRIQQSCPHHHRTSATPGMPRTSRTTKTDQIAPLPSDCPSPTRTTTSRRAITPQKNTPTINAGSRPTFLAADLHAVMTNAECHLTSRRRTAKLHLLRKFTHQSKRRTIPARRHPHQNGRAIAKAGRQSHRPNARVISRSARLLDPQNADSAHLLAPPQHRRPRR